MTRHNAHAGCACWKVNPFHRHDWRAAHDGDGWLCAGCGEWKLPVVESASTLAEAQRENARLRESIERVRRATQRLLLVDGEWRQTVLRADIDAALDDTLAAPAPDDAADRGAR